MHFALLSQQLWEWMEQFAQQYGYLGVFFISLIGASSIIFPIPYTLVMYLLGPFLDPFLIAITGGLGSAIGELSGYIIGYYGRAIVSEERRRKIDFMLRIFNRYGPAAVFLFALTPLPDDLIFIPLGIMRYSLLKVFIPCVLGKMLMCFILATGGRLSITFIKHLLGGGGWWEAMATVVLLIVVMVAMLKIDWEKVFILYVEKREKRSRDDVGNPKE